MSRPDPTGVHGESHSFPSTISQGYQQFKAPYGNSSYEQYPSQARASTANVDDGHTGSLAPYYGGSGYEQHPSQVQHSTANADTGHIGVCAEPYGLASTTNQGYQQPVALHHGSLSCEQYPSQGQASVENKDIGRIGIYEEWYELPSTTNQGYQSPVFHYSSYEQPPSQVQDSAANVGTSFSSAGLHGFTPTTGQGNQPFTAPPYGSSSYEQFLSPVRTSAADVDTGPTGFYFSSVSSYGFASATNQGYKRSAAPHHGSWSLGQYPLQVPPSAANVDTDHIGVHAEPYGFPSAANQKYQPSVAPHYGRSSYPEHPPQAHGSPTTFGSRPTPSTNDNFRCEVGSSAVTKASIERRRKSPRYECGVGGCVSTFTSQANLHYHTLAHQGVKPYPCGNCGRPFRSRHDRTRHGRRKTPCRPL
ncbi:hypothetical protein PM082_014312 [Marasmius tenuissimus]|nr:hypothetical protein PM082_014312 [Marasmius tenuissimus]